MTLTQYLEFKNFCINQHDIVCNQKYGEYPYSFHLRMVANIAKKFKYLSPESIGFNVILAGCYGHDLIEDARLTYNDIKEKSNEDVAEIIFLCTETRGRNRQERHSDLFFATLKENELAVFVKLCDIIANVMWSISSDSSMVNRYKKEFYGLYEKLGHFEQYQEMFKFLANLLQLDDFDFSSKKILILHRSDLKNKDMDMIFSDIEISNFMHLRTKINNSNLVLFIDDTHQMKLLKSRYLIE